VLDKTQLQHGLKTRATKMAWQDRPYYRDPGGATGNPLMWLLTGSVPLFTIFGIRVRMHASLLLVIVLVLLFGIGSFGSSVVMRVQSVSMLFMVILLHEFGHCFAARSVGGEANDILMTPLGGLAMAMAPRRPWATFVTVAGGPAVNVLICLICGIGIYLILGIFPLGPWTFGRILGRMHPGWLQLSNYLFWIYAISWFLLVFNLIPVYPLDGGQLLQSILWKPMGYYKSMIATMNVGLAGSVLMAMVGVATLGTIGGGLLLIFIAVNCFINCFQTRAMMKAEGPWAFTEEDDSSDYSAAYEPQTPRKSRLSKWSAARKRKRAMQQEASDRAEQEKLDAILKKVSAHGMQSLNWMEKRSLKQATERKRRGESSSKRR
jgi:Zn-dependent protease